MGSARVPKRRFHLTRFHGVFASNSKYHNFRSLTVAARIPLFIVYMMVRSNDENARLSTRNLSHDR